MCTMERRRRGAIWLCVGILSFTLGCTSGDTEPKPDAPETKSQDAADPE